MESHDLLHTLASEQTLLPQRISFQKSQLPPPPDIIPLFFVLRSALFFFFCLLPSVCCSPFAPKKKKKKKKSYSPHFPFWESTLHCTTHFPPNPKQSKLLSPCLVSLATMSVQCVFASVVAGDASSKQQLDIDLVRSDCVNPALHSAPLFTTNQHTFTQLTRYVPWIETCPCSPKKTGCNRQSHSRWPDKSL